MQGRDKEIERLNRALSGGRPHDVISLEAQSASNEKMIAHLNLQVSGRHYNAHVIAALLASDGALEND